MKVRDRIIDFRRVSAKELLPHPANWRTHPPAQEDAMRGILGQVGYADALVVRETPDGLQIINGHLRAGVTPEMDVPVLVVDVDDDEVDFLLATFDSVTELYTGDGDRLEALMARVNAESEAVQEMLAELQAKHSVGSFSDLVGTTLVADGGGEVAFEIVVRVTEPTKRDDIMALLASHGLAPTVTTVRV